jgi:SAM-dependent methyltransferase
MYVGCVGIRGDSGAVVARPADTGRVTADAFDVFEREGWRRGRASPYHRGLGPLTSQAVGALLDAARVGAGATVLDVATGPGYAAAQAAARAADVTAVDVSPEMVELAASLHPGVRFEVAEAAALPFAHASFDAVMANFLMPHVGDLPHVVAELSRVIRPGGRLALTTWDPDAPGFLRALMEAAAAAGATPPVHLPAGPDFFQYSGDAEFAALLSGAGLEGPAVTLAAFSHPVDDLEAFLDAVVDGTVRMNALIASQSPETRARISEGYAERLAPWRRDGGGFELPFGVKVGSASKPTAG